MRIRIAVLLFIITGNLQGYSQGLLDSLESVINSREGYERLALINQLASKYANVDVELAQQLAGQAFNLAENLNDNSGKAEAANTLGVTYYFQGHINQAEYYCILAQGLAGSINDLFLERKANTTLALIYAEAGFYEKSIIVYNRNVLIDLELKDKLSLGLDYQSIGRIYEMKKEPDSAVNYYLYAESIFVRGNYADRIVKIYSSLGNLYTMSNIDSARYFLLRSYALYKGNETLVDYYDIYWNCAEFYRQIGKADSAVYFLNLAVEKAEYNGNWLMLLNAYERLSVIYSRMGDFRNAYHFQALKEQLRDSFAIQASDSIFSSKISELENENRDQTVELLKKEAQLNENKWLSRDILYFLIVGCVFLIIFVAIAFYSRYKLFNTSISSAGKLKQDIIALTTEISERDKSIVELKSEGNRLKQRIQFLSSVLESIITTRAHPDKILISDLGDLVNNLKADRAGLMWMDGFNRLVSLGEYDVQNNRLSHGNDLSRKDYPIFFEMISNNKPMVTDNGNIDPRYVEFAEKRFLSAGRIARIDQPVSIENKLFGILFAEKNDPAQKWSDSELKVMHEMSEHFLPVLAHAKEDMNEIESENFTDIGSISPLLGNLELMIIDKSVDGIIYNAVPHEIDSGEFKSSVKLGNSWLAFIDRNDHERITAYYKSVINNNDKLPGIEYIIYDQTGNRLRITEEVLKTSETEQPARLLSAVYLKERESGDLKVMVNSFRAVIASLSHGLLVCGNSGNIILLNPALEKICGYSSDELVSGQLTVLFNDYILDSAHKGSLEKIKNTDMKTKTGRPVRCGITSRSFFINKSRYFVFEVYYNR